MSSTTRLAFISLCLGFFMVILDVTIVNVALPSIADYFSASLPSLQWAVDGYTLFFAGLLLLSGTLANRFGAKLVFQYGLILFSIMSLACGIANTIEELIIYRCLQGASGAIMLPPSLSLINVIYGDEKQRAKAIGIWASLGGVACASGPFLGGILTMAYSWRCVFLVNVVVGIFAFILCTRFIRNTKKEKNKLPFNYMSLVLVFCAIFCFAYSFIEVSSVGWKGGSVWQLFILGSLFAVFYLVREAKSQYPLVPFKSLKSGSVPYGMFASFFLNLSFYGVLFSLPFYFEYTRHYSTLTTGFALLPLSILAVFGSYLGGKSTSKHGPGFTIVLGQFVAILGYSSMYYAANSTTSYTIILLSFLLIGLGVSFTTPAMTFAAINLNSDELSNMASSALNTLNQIGSLIGVAIFGSIVNQSDEIAIGVGNTFLLACASTFFCLFMGFKILYFKKNIR